MNAILKWTESLYWDTVAISFKPDFTIHQPIKPWMQTRHNITELLNKILFFSFLVIIKYTNGIKIKRPINLPQTLWKYSQKKINLKPEIRVYDQPQTITSEADIESTLYSDNFLVFNILKNDGFYNVRYQIKPFMVWIWISIILISFGGILSIVKKNG